MFTSIEAAAEIGTTPRLLRRFLRDNDSWRAVGIGGRYMFTEEEVKSLNIQFHKWHKSSPTKKSEDVDPLDYLDQDKGITVEEMLELPKNPRLRADRLKARQDRMHRLNERMRACGIHPQPTYKDEEVDA
jgi:hypothetical protein